MPCSFNSAGLSQFLNLESRPEDGAVWARISDKKFSMPVMFTQAAIAAYVKKCVPIDASGHSRLTYMIATKAHHHSRSCPLLS